MTKAQGVWGHKPFSFCFISCYDFFFSFGLSHLSAHTLMHCMVWQLVTPVMCAIYTLARPGTARSRTILSKTKERPLNFNNFISWISVVFRHGSLSYFCIVFQHGRTSFCFMQILTLALLLWSKSAETGPRGARYYCMNHSNRCYNLDISFAVLKCYLRGKKNKMKCQCNISFSPYKTGILWPYLCYQLEFVYYLPWFFFVHIYHVNQL